MTMTKTNLLDETLAALEAHDHLPSDVLWVGTRHCSFTFKDFAERAKFINYDAGYGLAYIRRDLVVAGHNWWLERREYDGSEWWVHKSPPVQKAYGPCGNLTDNTADIIQQLEDLDTKHTAIIRALRAANGPEEINSLNQELIRIETEKADLNRQMDECGYDHDPEIGVQ
jgi:hypothetical protein